MGEWFNKKSLKIVLDMAINLVGTGISIAVLNFVIYPIVAHMEGPELYGQMQSIMAMIYLVGGTLGVSLCTTRLVLDFDYTENGIKGDFNFILACNYAVIILLLPVVLFFYIKNLPVIDIFLVTLIGVLNCAANYYEVGLRLKINYRAIFLSKILSCVGYLFGFWLFNFFYKWEVIFLSALLFEIVYYLLKTGIILEPYQRSVLFPTTMQTYLSLGVANFLGKALTYFDKLLIYPLLGGEAVTIYYVASIFGKIIIKTVEPIVNVIMSYLAKHKTVSKRLWKKVIVIAFFSCVIMFIVCIIISDPVIRHLYPQWFEEAVKYVPICTLCMAVSTFISLIRPFTLKTFESYKQIFINGMGVFVYSILVLLLFRTYGIYGCCYALLSSHAIKLLMIMFFCIARIDNDK